MRYLTPEEKQTVLKLIKDKQTIDLIAKTLNTTKECIKFYNRALIGEGMLPNKKRGRPKIQQKCPHCGLQI